MRPQPPKGRVMTKQTPPRKARRVSRSATGRSRQCPLDQDCINQAVTDLLEHAAPVTRTSLGAPEPADHMELGSPPPFGY